MLNVIALPAFKDNYIWLICNEKMQECAVVDPGDAEIVLTWLLENKSYTLKGILITHHHDDHTGGISLLKSKTNACIYASKSEHCFEKDYSVKDEESFTLLGYKWQVIATPGHTLDHISFLCDQADSNLLFPGDTLFSAGCGRLFEGTPEQMLSSLMKLSSLEENTIIYPAHEYTLSNINFACSVEPSNLDLLNYKRWVQEKTHLNKPTLPSNIGKEKTINPFLRTYTPTVRQAAEAFAGHALKDNVAIFSALREWKNGFQ